MSIRSGVQAIYKTNDEYKAKYDRKNRSLDEWL